MATNTVLVSDVAEGTSEAQLSQIFSQHGPVRGVSLNAGRAEVKFALASDATTAAQYAAKAGMNVSVAGVKVGAAKAAKKGKATGVGAVASGAKGKGK